MVGNQVEPTVVPPVLYLGVRVTPTITDHRSPTPVRMHPARSCILRGDIRAAPSSAPPGPIWCYRLELSEGAAIEWDCEHEDEAVVILSGALASDRHNATTASAFIVEADAPFRFHATEP